MAYNIPSKINSFNVYKDGTKLVGISDEVTLPDFESLTETLSGPGILGEIDDPTLGHFQSMEMEIPFRQMDKDLFILSDDISSVTVTLRGSIQYTVNDTGATAFKPMRVVVRGKNKGITGGKAKQGTGTGSSIKLELLYILIEIDNVTEIELDKLNFVYKVHGKDLLEKVRKMC
ncbi:MAG: phage major tail tube protein [Muribaculaceae bacterium]|uniref:phage major tail tube protein n=1 Tax=Lachnospiraceae TaxID=186803 RepID=UPI000EA3EEC7|nr:phage major tail tube protein [Acetatifactor aquisgranensis]MCX4312113.1 phage major tail tube protein [Muribaculaceae bacterium]NBH98545.1 phage tail protein [Lachnospiraceae bacterium]NDO50421.1 phage tail protein [Lachnospiraceae bacterium MD335]RKJ87092.1 phage tail protein [Anaerotruncus sp. 1XD22-93]NBI75491.1 phage tail protein [Lachnospiraceae bacterium]